MSGRLGDSDLELESELHRILDPMVGGPIPLRHAPVRRGFVFRLVGGAGAALAAKTVTGVAIAVLAAGAATEAVITHSLNPTTWAQQTLQVVEGKHTQPNSNSQEHSASSPAAVNTAPATPKPTGIGLPVTVPTVTPPTLPTVSPIALPTVPISPPPIRPPCGPLGSEIAPGC
jgi:hypothetical protein